MKANVIRRRYENQLLKTQGVSGVGQVGGQIIVYVENNPIDLPKTLDGVPVKIVKTGVIYALSLLWNSEDSYYSNHEAEPVFLSPKISVDPFRTERMRPVKGGCSIGHPSITAGTMGTSLRFLGLPYGLSNNHVLANGSSLQNPMAQLGDPIYQPGPYDGGGADDEVGTLSWYQPLDEEGVNFIDAAAFTPTSPDLLSDEIIDLGVPAGVGVADVGDVFIKSGRTTGITEGEVVDINASVNVNYGSFSISLQNQIMTENMAQGGDSGSADLDKDSGLLKGLLFAGSDYVTVHNHIGNVLSAIGGITPPGTRARGPISVVLPLAVGGLLLL